LYLQCCKQRLFGFKASRCFAFCQEALTFVAVLFTFLSYHTMKQLFSTIFWLFILVNASFAQSNPALKTRQVFKQHFNYPTSATCVGGRCFFQLSEINADWTTTPHLWTLRADEAPIKINIGNISFIFSDTVNGKFVFSRSTYLNGIPHAEIGTIDPQTLQQGTTGLLPMAGKRYFNNGRLIFTGSNSKEYPGPMWVTDGTAAGSQQILDRAGKLLSVTHLANGKSVFWLYEQPADTLQPSRINLVLSDGTAAGTTVLHEGSNVREELLAAVGDRIFFMDERKLWVSSSSAGSATPVFDFQQAGVPFIPSLPIQGVAFDGKLFFTTPAGLWQSDGTEVGTREVLPVRDAILYKDAGTLWLVGKNAGSDEITLWSAANASGDLQLHSNLSATYRLRDWSSARYLAQGGVAFIAARDGNGMEPMMIRNGKITAPDCWPGNGDFETYPGWWLFEQAGDQLFFTAQAPGKGRELWQVFPDGQAAVIADLDPGVRSPLIYVLGATDRHLFFLKSSLEGNFPDVDLLQLDLNAPPVPPGQPARPYHWMQTIWDGHNNFDDDFDFFEATQLVAGTSGSLYAMGSKAAGDTESALLNDSLYYNWAGKTILRHQLLSKIKANGKGDWMQLNGNNYDFPAQHAIAAAPEDGVYVAGLYSDRGYFGDQLIEVFEGGKFYLNHIDAEGKLRWMREADMDERSRVYRIAAAKSGDVLVLGYFEGESARFGSFLLEKVKAAGGGHFLVKYDKNGALQWAKTIRPEQNLEAKDKNCRLVMDEAGNSFLAFGAGAFDDEQKCPEDNRLLELIALDAGGELRWQRSFTGKIAIPTGLALGSDATIYLSAYYAGGLVMDANKRLEAICAEGNGYLWGGSSFVATLDRQNGELLAVKDFAPNDYRIKDLHSDAQGNYYVVGSEYQDSSVYYENYTQYPFTWENNYNPVMVRKFSPAHKLLSERAFFGYNNIPVEPRIALQPNGNMVLLCNQLLIGAMDTLGDAGRKYNSWGTYLLNFTLPPDNVEPTPADGQLEADAVALFPNPASDYVSLSSTDLDFSDAQADMFDLAGRQLNLPRIEGGQGFAYFSTKSLAAGMYIIRVRLGGQQISKPFVKVFK